MIRTESCLRGQPEERESGKEGTIGAPLLINYGGIEMEVFSDL